MEDKITKEKINKYFKLTETALKEVKKNIFPEKKKEAKEIITMVENYISDAHHFFDKDDWVNAFAALNYAHGWLDAGARIKLFKVKDSRLFTVDDE